MDNNITIINEFRIICIVEGICLLFLNGYIVYFYYNYINPRTLSLKTVILLSLSTSLLIIYSIIIFIERYIDNKPLSWHTTYFALVFLLITISTVLLLSDLMNRNMLN